MFGLLGALLGLWASTWGAPSGPDGGIATGLAGAVAVIGVAAAAVFLLAGAGLAGVGWWSLRNGRTRLPSVVLGAAVGTVGTGTFALLVPAVGLAWPLAVGVGGLLGHRLAPAPPGAEAG